MICNANRRREQLGRRRFPVATLVAASLAGFSNHALAEDSTASLTPAQTGGITNQALLEKMEAMEQRIKSLEAQLKDKDTDKARDKDKEKDKASSAPAAKTAASAAPDSKQGSKANDTKGAAAPTSPQGKPSAEPASGDATKLGQASEPAKPAAEDKSGDKTILGLVDSPVTGLSIGAYGEIQFGAFQNPDAGGQWQLGSDAARRLVLLPTYPITDNIIFNAEIEFEHAGPGFDNDDKLHGTAEIEQLWIDFKISDPVNWRAPGIDLVPIGWINQHHEPTEFYSVLRPELYNGLIPSTWKVPASSVYGTIVDGVRYQVMLSTAQEDFGDSFDCRTPANTVPPGIGTVPCTQGGAAYFPGIDGLTAMAFSNPPLGDFLQLSNSLAISGRVDFTEPVSLPGLAWSISAYYTPNVEPRGAHGDLGNLLGSASLAMFDAEFRYRVPKTGWEFRGEGVFVTFGNPANMRANNDTDPTDNVGRTMYGVSAEVAYHVPLGTILHTEWEAVPFYRYTYENLQTPGFAGTDLNTPTGAGQLQFHNIGVAIFPSPKIVLKATYQKVINNDPAGANSDSFLGGVGFFF
jgi:hypothetical protein